MKVGIEFVPYSPLKKLGELGKEIEKAGFDHIWVSDHYHNRFVHSVLSYLALKTNQVSLGPGVTNPYLIHPAVTAAASATLDELSDGRATLGISAGDPFFLQTVGMKHEKPITTVRESIEVIRGLLSGEKFDYSGEKFSCNGAEIRFSPKKPIPIYVGGRGKQMLGVAGSHADGALINAAHPEDIKESIKYIKKGAEKADVDLEDFDFVAYMATSLGDDVEKAREKARTVTAFVASSAPKSSIERENISDESIEEVRKHLKSGNISKARDAVTGKMIDAFSVSGKIDLLESRIRELKKLGVTQVVTGSPIGLDTKKAINQIGEILD
ncbi:MAG: 5,10-methylenetetrahydromethanopterin reductase [Hadesarchaea archaeon]|nr:5,10-methylenetetrahydromethanopterin reductase [Hadesarchaea archaeon]